MRDSLTFSRLIAVLLALDAAGFTSVARATPPVPFYNSHVIAIEKIGDGSVVISTKDASETVYAWYRRNLRNANGDTKTKHSAHILYTQSGATVDIEPGDPSASGSNIGIVWDASRYGAYPTKHHQHPPAPRVTSR